MSVVARLADRDLRLIFLKARGWRAKGRTLVIGISCNGGMINAKISTLTFFLEQVFSRSCNRFDSQGDKNRWINCNVKCKVCHDAQYNYDGGDMDITGIITGL